MLAIHTICASPSYLTFVTPSKNKKLFHRLQGILTILAWLCATPLQACPHPAETFSHTLSACIVVRFHLCTSYNRRNGSPFPLSWFYSLRDMGRSANQRLPPAAGMKATASCSVSLPTPNYYKLVSAHSPVKYGIRFAEQFEDEEQAEIRIVSRRPKRKAKKSSGTAVSSALINSGVSAGCSCKATVGSRRSGFKSFMFLNRRSNVARNHPVPKRNSRDMLKLERLGSAPVGWNFPARELQASSRETLELVKTAEKRGRRPAYVKSRKYLTGLPAKVISAEDPDIVEKSEDSDSFSLQKVDASTVRGNESMPMVQGAVAFPRGDASDSSAMKCSALCCSCRLSISSVEAERDAEESQLWDVDFWSEDDEFPEARERIRAPFLSTNRSDNSNRLLLDMTVRFSPGGDSKESPATASRRDDAISTHAQAQARLNELIEARGTKIDSRRVNIDADHYCSENEKNSPDWKQHKGISDPRPAVVTRESGPEIILEEDCGNNNSLAASRHSGRTLEEYSAKDRVTNFEDIPAVVSDDREDRKLEKSVSQLSIKSGPPSSRARMASVCGNGKTHNSSCRSPKINGDRVEDVKGKRERRSASTARSVNSKQRSPREKLKERVSVVDDVAVSDAQRKISESLAIVKCSYDPWKDFRDSMVEMIVENEIRDSRDLQELLRCYVSLNSEEYRPMILQVFEQVRSDMIGEI